MLNQSTILQRLKEHQLLSEVALMLASTLDIKKLYRHTLDAVHALLEVEHAALFFPDEIQENLVSQAGIGRFGEIQISLAIQSSSAGESFRTRESVTLQGEVDLNGTHTTRTAHFIPMTTSTRIMGLLAVYTNQEFSGQEIGLLQKLATHAAYAIQNAQSHQEIEARSFELALIIDATEAVNTTLDLSRILSLIGKNLLKALHVNWSEIVTYQNKALSTLAVQRECFWQPEKAKTFSLDHYPLLKEALLQKHPVTLHSPLDGYDLFLEALPRTDFYPVEVDGKVLGLLQLISTEEISPPASMQALAQYVKDREWRRALHALRPILRETQAHRLRFWQWEESKIHLILDEGGVNWVESNHSPTRTIDLLPTFEALLPRQSISEYTLNAPNVPADIAAFMEQEKIQALLVLPLVVQDDKLGLVLVGDTVRTSPFQTREIALGHALVLQAANAIKNAQLYNDLQIKIEELSQTQAKLVQTARLSAIGELAAAVAHQINNPLTTVLGDTELVLTYLSPDDPNWESLQAVHRAGQRAHHVVKRLLGMARQKPDDDVVQLIDINATIQNTLDLVEVTFQRNKVELQVELGENLPPAMGMHGHLEDVWLNLLLNARDAILAQEEKQVGIRTRYIKAKNVVQIGVWDNGPGFGGIDPAVLFDAFYTTKPPSKGTGLGLYICKNVVERCHGTIHAESNQPNGAVFIVTLPCERDN